MKAWQNGDFDAKRVDEKLPDRAVAGREPKAVQDREQVIDAAPLRSGRLRVLQAKGEKKTNRPPQSQSVTSSSVPLAVVATSGSALRATAAQQEHANALAGQNLLRQTGTSPSSTTRATLQFEDVPASLLLISSSAECISLANAALHTYRATDLQTHTTILLPFLLGGGSAQQGPSTRTLREQADGIEYVHSGSGSVSVSGSCTCITLSYSCMFVCSCVDDSVSKMPMNVLQREAATVSVSRSCSPARATRERRSKAADS